MYLQRGIALSGVKLHHSLNHVYVIRNSCPKYRLGHPAGHPKLLQLDNAPGRLFVFSPTFLYFPVFGAVCSAIKPTTLGFPVHVKLFYRVHRIGIQPTTASRLTDFHFKRI